MVVRCSITSTVVDVQTCVVTHTTPYALLSEFTYIIRRVTLSEYVLNMECSVVS